MSNTLLTAVSVICVGSVLACGSFCYIAAKMYDDLKRLKKIYDAAAQKFMEASANMDDLMNTVDQLIEDVKHLGEEDFNEVAD